MLVVAAARLQAFNARRSGHRLTGQACGLVCRHDVRSNRCRRHHGTLGIRPAHRSGTVNGNYCAFRTSHAGIALALIVAASEGGGIVCNHGRRSWLRASSQRCRSASR
jgi:hypothetical protein